MSPDSWVRAARRYWSVVLVAMLAISLFGVAGAGSVPTAHAEIESWTVTTTGDDAGTVCATSTCPTLRDALLSADSDDTITFASGVTGVISLTYGQLTVPAGVKIQGPGSSVLAIDGSNESRVFLIEHGAVTTITGLTIQDGNMGDVSFKVAGRPLHASTVVGTHKLPVTHVPVKPLTHSVPTSVAPKVHAVAVVRTLVRPKPLTHGTLVVPASDDGGGIYNEGSLTLANSVVLSNTAGYLGGGIFSDDSFGSPAVLTLINTTVMSNVAEYGAGIFSYGESGSATLTVLQSTVVSNTAYYEGGGIYSDGEHGSATATVTNSTVSYNEAYDEAGGGLYNDGSEGSASLTVTGSTVDDNYAYTFGGGIESVGSYGGLGQLTVTSSHVDVNYVEYYDGGGIDTYSDYGGQALNTLTGSTVDNNYTGEYGGGIETDAFDGQVTNTIQTTDISYNIADEGDVYGGGGLFVTAEDTGSAVTNLAYSTVTNNYAYYYGGGIYNDGDGYTDGIGGSSLMTLTSTLVYSNEAYYYGGGGIFNDGSYTGTATLALVNSAVLTNTVYDDGDGGGIFNDAYTNGHATTNVSTSTIAGNYAVYYGGGIYNDSVYTGTAVLTVTRSLLNGNTTDDEYGGGIFDDATNTGTTQVALVNDTLTNNYAYYGGALYTQGTGSTVGITNSTVVSNTASYGGAIYQDNPSTVTLANDILAANVSGNCDVYGVTDNGGNLADDTTCDLTAGTSSQSATLTALNLGPLADNGGPTQTYALLPTSTAIGYGVEATCLATGSNEPNGVDQRGVLRSPVACDSGAYEVSNLNSPNFASELNVIPATLFGGVVGVPYPPVTISGQYTGSGTAPTSYTVTPGPNGQNSLPPGLMLASNGLLSGIPLVAGTYTFTATVSGIAIEGGLPVVVSGQREYTVTIVTSCTLAGASAVNGYVLQPYFGTLTLVNLTASSTGVVGSVPASGGQVVASYGPTSASRYGTLTVKYPVLGACTAGTGAIITGKAGTVGLARPGVANFKVNDQLLVTVVEGTPNTGTVQDLTNPLVAPLMYTGMGHTLTINAY